MNFALLTFLLASPVQAQEPYVGASLVGDVLRLDRYDSGGSPDMSGSGEALGFALRVGVPLGRRWGVELEFARPTVIESEWSPDIYPLAELQSYVVAVAGASAPQIVPDRYSIFAYEVRSRRRNNTLATGLWAMQEVSRRMSLVYLGGIGFHRTEQDIEYQYGSRLAPIPITILPPPSYNTESVTYGVHPYVGFEARIGMTRHVELVPGVRLHGVTGGWLLRPSVGLGWSF